ncbi:MAG: hypothetical protein CMJ94_01935 [Planctomycetes bacterium]|nr:hypothetical protein [Planctomycetota bacterium]
MQEPEVPPRIEELLAHHGWVRRLSRHLVADEAEAAEVEQETWRRALEAPPRHSSNLKAWLASVVRTAAAQRQRRPYRRHERAGGSQSDAPGEVAVNSQPDELLEERETFSILQNAVAELEDPYGEVVFLRYVKELPPRQIAKRLGIPVGTVKTRLHRGLQLLRHRVRQRLGTNWHARCMVFVPSLPAAVASSIHTIAMTKTAQWSAAAGVLLLGLPLIYLASSSPDSSPFQGPPEAQVAGVYELAAQFQVETPNATNRLPVSESSRDAVLRIPIRDSEGRKVSVQQIYVFRDREVHELGAASEPSSFLWPLDEETAGVVTVQVRGRVPEVLWFDPTQQDEIRLDVGRELFVEVPKLEEPERVLRQLRLNVAALRPTVDHPIYPYREHWPDQGRTVGMVFGTGLAAEAEGSRARFWGLPEEQEFTLPLRMQDSLGRLVGASRSYGSNWELPVSTLAGTVQITVEPWPEWSLTVDLPPDPVYPERKPGAGVYLEDRSGRLSMSSVTYEELEPGRRVHLRISRTDRLPPSDHPDGWRARVRTHLAGAWVEVPFILPHEAGDLGLIEIPAPTLYRVRVLDENGQAVPQVNVRSQGEAEFNALTDGEGCFLYPSLAAKAAGELPPRREFFVSTPGYMPNVHAVQLKQEGAAEITLESEHGLDLSILLKDHAGEIAQGGVLVFLRCQGDDLRRPGGLFGRELTDLEDQWLVPEAIGAQYGHRGDLWGVEVATALRERDPSWEGGEMRTRILGLDPTHPVELVIQRSGVELYREEFPVWPTGQLVKRKLELQLPAPVRVEGIVCDPEGNRIPDAHVEIELGDEQSVDLNSDSFGVFGYEPIFVDSVRISAAVSGGEYVECEPMEARADESGKISATVILKPAHPIVVEVRHADGSLLDAEDLDARVAGGKVRLWRGREKLGPGKFQIQAPREGQVEVSVYYENWRHRATLTIGQEPYVLRLIQQYPVQVQLPEGLGPGGRVTWLNCRRDAPEPGWASFALYGDSRLPPSVAGEYQEAVLLPEGQYTASLDQGVDGAWLTVSEEVRFQVSPSGQATIDLRSARPVPPDRD